MLGYFHIYRDFIQTLISYGQGANDKILTFAVYLIVTLCSLIFFFPEIRFGIQHSTKESINDILSLTVFTMVCSAGLVLVCQLFGLSYTPGDATMTSASGVITALFLSPIYEEILCRGVIFKIGFDFTKSTVFAICISTIIFAIFHIDFSAKVVSQELVKTAVILCLGLSCGTSYYKTNSIIYPIGVHIIWNTFMVTASIIFSIA